MEVEENQKKGKIRIKWAWLAFYNAIKRKFIYQGGEIGDFGVLFAAAALLYLAHLCLVFTESCFRFRRGGNPMAKLSGR